MKKKQVLSYLVLFLACVGLIFFWLALGGYMSSRMFLGGLVLLGPLFITYMFTGVFFALFVVNLFLKEKSGNDEHTKNSSFPIANRIAIVIGIMCLLSTLFLEPNKVYFFDFETRTAAFIIGLALTIGGLSATVNWLVKTVAKK